MNALRHKAKHSHQCDGVAPSPVCRVPFVLSLVISSAELVCVRVCVGRTKASVSGGFHLKRISLDGEDISKNGQGLKVTPVLYKKNSKKHLIISKTFPV